MTVPLEKNLILPPDADPRLGPVLSGLVACLCATLADGGRPACACCLVWGSSPPAQDFCSCDCDDGHGQAWVRVVRQDPVTSEQRRRRCQNGQHDENCDGTREAVRRVRAVLDAGGGKP